MVSAIAESLHILHNLFAIKPRRQVREMYVFLLLFSFAAGLITVFEPIFFFKEGFPMWQIALYYALHYTLYIFLLPVGGIIASRIGYERSLTLSTPVFVVYFVLLAALPSYHFLAWIAAIVLTLFKILYWPAYHANFSAHTDSKNSGTEQSWVKLVQYTAGIAGPLLGGIIVMKFGFPALFIVTAFMVAIAGASLLRTTEHERITPMRYIEPWQMMASPRFRSMVIGMIGWGENLIYLIVWPIFVFIMVGSVETIGLIASLGTLVATFMGFIVGEVTDRISARGALRYLIPIVTGAYLLRLLATTAGRTMLIDIFSRGTIVMVNIPILVRLYMAGKKVGSLKYCVSFEMVLAISKALTAFGIGILFVLAPEQLAYQISFVAAALFTLLYYAF